jgi:hypothetical protein
VMQQQEIRPSCEIHMSCSFQSTGISHCSSKEQLTPPSSQEPDPSNPHDTYLTINTNLEGVTGRLTEHRDHRTPSRVIPCHGMRFEA